jgi:hypothetical protein
MFSSAVVPLSLRRFTEVVIASVTVLLFTMAACIAAYFAIRSLLVASTETSSLPFGDIWRFYVDYFKYIDGNYSFWHLFDHHNEHIIFTTRLALFVDTILFRASGKFVLALVYFTALVTALMVAYLAAGPRKWEVFGLTVVFLGLTWAKIQIDNLTMPFQVGFPLAHAFALATLIALWRGLVSEKWWYVLAFACDFLAVFSLGTGAMVGVSAVALSVWARKWDRVFALFLVFHVTLIVLYAWLAPGLPAAIPSLTVALAYFTTFLGNFAARWPDWCLPVGIVVAVLCAGLFSWLTWRSLGGGAPPTGEVVVLAAFVLFVILEAAAAVYRRSQFGTDQAMSLRYTTCTLLLVAALFAVAWRLFPQWFGRIPTLIALIAVMFAVNPSLDGENGWRARNQEMDALAAVIAKGSLPQGAAGFLCVTVSPEVFSALVWRFRASGLGPFWKEN